MMKKVILSAAALLFGVFAYAQYGPQYVGPTPTATLQTALPGSGAGANTGLSIQNGNDHKVRVRQAGTSQSAYTYQDDGTGAGGNQAIVRQTGAVQASSGYLNAAEVYQHGTYNQSRTRQEGDNNSAITRQGENDLGSQENKSYIRQGIADQAENNIAQVNQDGDYNQASILQTYDNNEAWTVQNGEGNKSKVIQDAAPEDTPGHYAYTDQNGENNESAISQSGAGQSNWAWAYQDGENNESIQTQVESDTPETGYVNYALVDQGANQPGLITSDMMSDLTAINGAVGSTPASTPTTNSLAIQSQVGGDLDAETHQFGDGNYSEQNQTGYGNDAFILQNGASVAGNYGRQDQSGTQSFAGLAQVGNGNKAWQRQTDDDNIILSTQVGDGNVLNTFQDGDSNRGITSQIGECNAALLVQRGGHSYSVYQDGSHNQADILQLGPNGNFATDGIDCAIMDPLSPDIDYTVPGVDLEDICPDCD